MNKAVRDDNPSGPISQAPICIETDYLVDADPRRYNGYLIKFAGYSQLYLVDAGHARDVSRALALELLIPNPNVATFGPGVIPYGRALGDNTRIIVSQYPDGSPTPWYLLDGGQVRGIGPGLPELYQFRRSPIPLLYSIFTHFAPGTDLEDRPSFPS